MTRWLILNFTENIKLYQDVKDKSKTSTKPKKFENTDEVNSSSPKENPNQSRTNIDPVFTKKGKVVYWRRTGFKTRNLDGKGSGVLVDDTIKANDTFPSKKVPPDFIYPLK